MGNSTSGTNKSVALIVGILLVLTVAGSFLDAGTIAATDDLRYLRF